MASTLATAFGTSDDEPSARSPITHYKIAVKDDDKGVPVFRLLAKRADGTGSKYGNLFVWLDQPHAARALREALPLIAKALDAVDEAQVKAKEWPAKATAPKAAAPATPPPAPKKSAAEAAFDDLPF